jgi:hypothetical protein
MKLLLSEYLRGLRERNELDVLLPRLLIAKGIMPLTRTQQGTRQFGVDLAAVGTDPEDAIMKLFLFVLKRGDLGRNDWDSGPQSVRQSINEIFDVYVHNSIAPKYANLPRVVIVASTGDMKQEIQSNWTGLAKQHEQRAELRFWSADQLACFIEDDLLTENLFAFEHKQQLRRALSLSGEPEYTQEDLHAVFQSVLGINKDGSDIKEMKHSELQRSLSVLALSERLFSHWARTQRNSKQALIASERALLWGWHKIRKQPAAAPGRKLRKDMEQLRTAHKESIRIFLDIMRPYYVTEDGLSSVPNFFDHALISLCIFEHIGILASAGLMLLDTEDNEELVDEVLAALEGVIVGNSSASSPRLDEHVIDINLAMLLLIRRSRLETARIWLHQLITKVCFAFRTRRNFPVNSVDELTTNENQIDEEVTGYNYPSWMIATLGDWCVWLDDCEAYSRLSAAHARFFPKVCPQRWYATLAVEDRFFFGAQWEHAGRTEAPVELPETMEEYKSRFSTCIRSADLFEPKDDWERPLGLLACRHFRSPVPPAWIYRELLEAAPYVVPAEIY